MTEDDEYHLDNLTKYENYCKDNLLRDAEYLLPTTTDPFQAGETLAEMHENDLAHLYAVLTTIKRRYEDQ